MIEFCWDKGNCVSTFFSWIPIIVVVIICFLGIHFLVYWIVKRNTLSKSRGKAK